MDNKPILSDTEWQQASSALALMRLGCNDVRDLRRRLKLGAGKMSELLSNLSQLELVLWIDGQPYLTQKGADSCRLITLAAGDENGALVPLKETRFA
jgi:hypothetical protein